MKEEDVFVVEDSPESRGPYPVVVGNDLRVDGTTIMAVNSTSEALVAVVLAHSVFHLRFSKKVSSLFFYVQRYVMGIDDGLKAPLKCLTFVRDLKQLGHQLTA